MIPTVILVALLAGLLVPQRWAWWLGVALACAAAWGVVIAFQPDATPTVVLGAVALGLGNAVVGVVLAAVVRLPFERRGRHRAA